MDYQEAAVVLWGEAGRHVHDAYRRHRVEHLPDLPAQLPIVIGITAYGHCAGLTRPNGAHGPRISIASNLFHTGRRRVDDTVLHEMLHAHLVLNGENPHHDGAPWYEAVRRLSPAVLGHPVKARRGAARRAVRIPNPAAGQPDQPATLVRKVPVLDAIAHSDVARWPAAFRPAGYDWGEPIPCPSY